MPVMPQRSTIRKEPGGITRSRCSWGEFDQAILACRTFRHEHRVDGVMGFLWRDDARCLAGQNAREEIVEFHFEIAAALTMHLGLVAKRAFPAE